MSAHPAMEIIKPVNKITRAFFTCILFWLGMLIKKTSRVCRKENHVATSTKIFISFIRLNGLIIAQFQVLTVGKIPPILKNTVNKKVLIVDDEVDICNLLSWILKQKNLAPSYVNTLSDAEVALEKDTPYILFLDNYLPDGFGVEFIQFVKENYPATKIIMITAHDSFSEKQKALNRGADFFISKPFTKALINETIDNLLN